jgi:hypothetical protein
MKSIVIKPASSTAEAGFTCDISEKDTGLNSVNPFPHMGGKKITDDISYSFVEITDGLILNHLMNIVY